jgi:phosphoglycolate phosphatase-like HAD superfamily hydrolase
VAVGCAWGLNPREELRALQPDHLIESLPDLAALYAPPRSGHRRETT